jgi:MGT family glycosyltransferase
MMGQVTASLFRSLPATLAAAGADVIVLDQYHPYVELVPMSLGMPYVHVSNALHVDWTGRTPICFTDWPHESGPAALARNREGVARYRKMLEPTIAIAQDYARKSGLSIDWSDPNSTVSPLAWVTQTPRAFDFESAHRPTQFHYAGPFHDGHGRVASEFPWERLTGEPLVYVSMGTLQNGIDAAFRSIAEASGNHKGTQFVFSIGPQLDSAQMRNVPGNAIVVNHAPQLELLKRSALCITHAGLNTVLEALAQGVPLLAIPVTNDQPGVAARVSAKGVGLKLALDEVTSTNISDCAGRILNDPAFSERTSTMKSAIALADGLTSAASVIEMAFGLKAVASAFSSGRHQYSR